MSSARLRSPVLHKMIPTWMSEYSMLVRQYPLDLTHIITGSPYKKTPNRWAAYSICSRPRSEAISTVLRIPMIRCLVIFRPLPSRKKDCLSKLAGMEVKSVLNCPINIIPSDPDQYAEMELCGHELRALLF